MDWQFIAFLIGIGALVVSLAVLKRVEKIADRIEAIEVDRACYTDKREKEIEGLGADLWELKDLLKDLVDFEKGDGRYRHDPDDPRLPAHLRDQTGRDY